MEVCVAYDSMNNVRIRLIKIRFDVKLWTELIEGELQNSNLPRSRSSADRRFLVRSTHNE